MKRYDKPEDLLYELTKTNCEILDECYELIENMQIVFSGNNINFEGEYVIKKSVEEKGTIKLKYENNELAYDIGHGWTTEFYNGSRKALATILPEFIQDVYNELELMNLERKQTLKNIKELNRLFS